MLDANRSSRSRMEFFQRVTTFYEQYYSEPGTKGVSSHKQTEKGFWISSVSSEVFALFSRIRLERFKHFADLGSGDGKVASIASLFTKSTGIEFGEELVERSIEIKKVVGLTNVEFIKGDFIEEDLRAYDILFIYPDNPIIRLERKLLGEMKGLLIVCGGMFLPDKLVKKKVVQVNNAVFGLYQKGWLRRFSRAL